MAEIAMEVAAPLQRSVPLRRIAPVLIGNALEFYDFTTYAYFAKQIGDTFFPSHSPFVSLMGSLAAFGIGFAARPVGAILIGGHGDKHGRKPAMLLSFTLMGIAIVLLAATLRLLVIAAGFDAAAPERVLQKGVGFQATVVRTGVEPVTSELSVLCSIH